MADLAERMKKTAAPKRAAKAEPFKAAPPAFEKRVTLDLTADDHRAMKTAALDTDTNMSDLLRALVALFREDPNVAAAAKARAKQ